jgi:aryl carrier-like protein
MDPFAVLYGFLGGSEPPAGDSHAQLAALGLSSVSLVRLRSEARRRGVTLSIAELLSATVSDAALWLAVPEERLEPLPPVNFEICFTPRELEYVKIALVMTFELELLRPLDGGRLTSAWQQLCLSQRNMRSSYVALDGTYRKIVCHPNETVCIYPSSFSLERVQESSTAIQRLQGPASRLVLFTDNGQVVKAFCLFHHAVADGFSVFSIILPSLARLYEADCAGSQVVLPTDSLEAVASAHQRYLLIFQD